MASRPAAQGERGENDRGGEVRVLRGGGLLNRVALMNPWVPFGFRPDSNEFRSIGSRIVWPAL